MAKRWVITIKDLPDGTVAFRPDVPGAQPGQPLGVNTGDNVVWNNTTNKAHWPVAMLPSGLFLTKDIEPGRASRPSFNVQNSVTYMCLHHPQERGMIVVVSDLVS
jgi:hypothetical protein